MALTLPSPKRREFGAYPNTVSEKGTVPFCSADRAKLGQTRKKVPGTVNSTGLALSQPLSGDLLPLNYWSWRTTNRGSGGRRGLREVGPFGRRRRFAGEGTFPPAGP